MIRVSVYSDNLSILWKSVQDAFARAGFGFMRDCDCPEDAASGGLPADEMVTPQLRALVRRLEEFANNGKVGGLILRGGELTLALNTGYVFANVPNAIDMRDIDGIRKWFTASLTGMRSRPGRATRGRDRPAQARGRTRPRPVARAVASSSRAPVSSVQAPASGGSSGSGSAGS